MGSLDFACSGRDQLYPDFVVGSYGGLQDVTANCEESLVLTVPHVDRLHIARGNAGVSKAITSPSAVMTRTPCPRGHRRILHQCLRARLVPTFPMAADVSASRGPAHIIILAANDRKPVGRVVTS